MLFCSRIIAISLLLFASEMEAGAAWKCPELFQKISDKLRPAKNAIQLFRGRLTYRLSEQDFAIFEKVRANPFVALSMEENQLIQEHGLSDALLKYRATNRFVQNYNHHIAMKQRVHPLQFRAPTLGKKFKQWFFQGLRFLTGGLPIGPKAKANRLFLRLLRAPEYQLSAKEAKFLKDWNLAEDYERFKREIENYKKGFLSVDTVRKFKEGVNYTYWGLIGAPAIGTSAMLSQMEEEKLSPEQAFDPSNPKGIQLSRTTELILRDNGLPPILVVDNLAFVFGQGTVSLIPPKKMPELIEILKSETLTRVRLNTSGAELGKLKKHVADYITRKQKQEDGTEVLSERSYLDLPSAEVYRALSQALELPPLPWFSRSDNLVLTLFKAMKVMGSDRVEGIYHVGGNQNFDAGEMGSDAMDAYVWSLTFSNLAFLTGTGILDMNLDSTRMVHQRPIPANKK